MIVLGCWSDTLVDCEPSFSPTLFSSAVAWSGVSPTMLGTVTLAPPESERSWLNAKAPPSASSATMAATATHTHGLRRFDSGSAGTGDGIASSPVGTGSMTDVLRLVGSDPVEAMTAVIPWAAVTGIPAMARSTSLRNSAAVW